MNKYVIPFLIYALSGAFCAGLKVSPAVPMDYFVVETDNFLDPTNPDPYLNSQIRCTLEIFRKFR
jgi:hypothetical protein